MAKEEKYDKFNVKEIMAEDKWPDMAAVIDEAIEECSDISNIDYKQNNQVIGEQTRAKNETKIAMELLKKKLEVIHNDKEYKGKTRRI